MSPPVIRICVVLVRQSVMLFFSGSTHKQACLCSTVCWWRDGWGEGGEGGEGGRRGSWVPQHHSHRLPPPLRPVSWGHAVKGHAPRRQVKKTPKSWTFWVIQACFARFEAAFFSLGSFAAEKPLPVIIACSLFTALGCAGLPFIRFLSALPCLLVICMIVMVGLQGGEQRDQAVDSPREWLQLELRLALEQLSSRAETGGQTTKQTNKQTKQKPTNNQPTKQPN